jgi:hypothetical protein
MKIFTPYILYLFGLMLFFAGCDDLHDVSNESNKTEIDEETAEVYILNEGLFNLNNSSLARYSFKDGSLTANYFSNINKRGLGDTANDMQLYGSKLYVVVNVSSEIEVIDFSSGKSLKQIPMVNEKGVSRQPRYITFAKGNAYVCSFDGTVARIDTTSLTVDGLLTVGRNPDGICTTNGKLYVSNSGGLDAENIGVDHTVSVIDLYSFTETKKIDVGPNPGKIIATVDGTVYVVTRGQNIKSGDYHLVAIDSKTDNVIDTLDEKVLNLAVNGDIAYMYQYNYKTSTSSIKAFSLKDKKTLRDNFITDGTKIQTPYAINVNPYSGNVYIADAYDYTSKGDLLCFNPQGVLQFRLKDIGLNPNTILFTDQVTSNEAAGGTSAYDYAYADSVLEYCPAPTQYMNTSLTAYKEGYTANDVLREATTCLKQKTTLTLGAFGGYVIVGFNHTVKHVSGEYDFKIFGNAYTNEKSNSYGKTNGSAEPGIVWVSQDTNGNGKPDDEWYEIAGSEYGKSSETRDYTITYYRPSAGGDVKWTDNKGNSGYIYRNEWHTQSSYYPLWMADKISFNGTRLADNAVNEGTASSQYWVSYPYDWGYADNYPNNTEYSNIKLDWAVDSKGNKVNLPGIDFIKVTTAVNQNMGWMGEASTEILTIQDLHYNN